MKKLSLILSITLSVVLIASLILGGLALKNLDQEMAGAKNKLDSVEFRLNETSNDNKLLEEKIKTAEADLKSSQKDLRETEKKLISLIQNKTAELERSKADRRELGLVEFGLMENINDLEVNFKKNLAMAENKIFDPATIYGKSKKAVVRIEIGVNFGTGFLFVKKNQVLTAYHVVKSPPGTYVKVFPSDGVYSSVSGRVKRIKPEWDLAIIELAVSLDAEPLKPSDVRNLAIGDSILLIGNPNNLNNTASAGIVSGFDRKLKNLPLVRTIQIDSSIDFGSSGSPAIDKNSEMIGMVSMGMVNSSFSFIIPVNYISSFLGEE
ncbi:MAG: trypsin-like peptidase domain-containing protein [bacterium]|nr:trypsin-like peptidase domain-containing protein [bacterium]